MAYYTAITLKLNTKPWKQDGVTSRHNYSLQLAALAIKFNCTVDSVHGYELDKQCQLHVHTTLVSTKILHRASICKWYRHKYQKHSIWLVPITNLRNWQGYCQKTGNEEEKYHWLCRFYSENYPDEFNDEEMIRNIQHTRFTLADIQLNIANHWEKCEIDPIYQTQFID